MKLKYQSQSLDNSIKQLTKNVLGSYESPLSLGFPAGSDPLTGGSSYSLGSSSLPSVSSVSSSPSGDSGNWLGSAINLGLGFGDAWFGGDFSYADDGTITANPSWWDKYVTGNDREMELYAHTYNQQIQFANRQQELAENAVLNNARQLQQLGINPAGVGQSLAGASASGGSAPSPSSAPFSSSNRLALLTALLNYKLKERELDIAQDNSDVNAYNAKTSRISANANAGHLGSQQAMLDYSLQFLKDNGYNVPNGYSNTESSVNLSHTLNFLNFLIIGYSMFRNNGKNPPSGSSGGSRDSGRSSSSASSSSDSVADSSEYRLISTSQSGDPVQDVQDSVYDYMRYVTTTKDKSSGSDVPLSRQISDALEDMNSQEVTKALSMLWSYILGGSTVPVF